MSSPSALPRVSVPVVSLSAPIRRADTPRLSSRSATPAETPPIPLSSIVAGTPATLTPATVTDDSDVGFLVDGSREIECATRVSISMSPKRGVHAVEARLGLDHVRAVLEAVRRAACGAVDPEDVGVDALCQGWG